MQQNPAPLHLERHDPVRNMARFYALSLDVSLFGEALLVRRWGRIGTRGRERADVFVSPDEAAAAMQALASRKVRRGYRSRPSPLPACPHSS